MSPGDADSYSEVIQQTPGADVNISANAYLPIKKIQSNAGTSSTFPEMCEEERCCNAEEDGVRCGNLPCCCPLAYAPVGENCACEYVGT